MLLASIALPAMATSVTDAIAKLNGLGIETPGLIMMNDIPDEYLSYAASDPSWMNKFVTGFGNGDFTAYSDGSHAFIVFEQL